MKHYIHPLHTILQLPAIRNKNTNITIRKSNSKHNQSHYIYMNDLISAQKSLLCYCNVHHPSEKATTQISPYETIIIPQQINIHHTNISQNHVHTTLTTKHKTY